MSENKHPHRVAIEYLAKLLEGDEQLSDSAPLKIQAAQAILHTDYYALLPPDQPAECEFIGGKLGHPTQIKVSIPGESEKFPGCFIEFPELPEGEDQWYVIGGGQPIYRIESDGTVVDLAKEKATPYIPPPEIYPGSNTDVQGSAEPPVFFRLNKTTGEELKVSAWDNQAGKVVNGHYKYPSPGTVEAVKILDDARYNGFRWGFAWKSGDPTKDHHPNAKVCNCVQAYVEYGKLGDDTLTGLRSRISEDEAIYLAGKIAKEQEAKRNVHSDARDLMSKGYADALGNKPEQGWVDGIVDFLNTAKWLNATDWKFVDGHFFATNWAGQVMLSLDKAAGIIEGMKMRYSGQSR